MNVTTAISPVAQFTTFDPEAQIGKFAEPGQIALVHAGGDAGFFSMVYGTWISGESGSSPVTRSVEAWA